MARIPPRLTQSLQNAADVVRQEQEQASEEAQAAEFVQREVVAQTQDDFGPNARRARGGITRRNAVTWPLRPHGDGRSGLVARPRTTQAGASPRTPAPTLPQLHPSLVGLFEQMREKNDSLRLADDASILLLGVKDHTLQHLPLLLLRRLLLGLTAHHPEQRFAEDVRVELVNKARRSLFSGHRAVTALLKEAKKLVWGSQAPAFATVWQDRVGELHTSANATLAAEREHLPMLPDEGAIWHHVIETLRPYELQVAQAQHAGTRLEARAAAELVHDLSVMEAIFDDWLDDPQGKLDVAPPYVNNGPPAYRS